MKRPGEAEVWAITALASLPISAPAGGLYNQAEPAVNRMASRIINQDYVISTQTPGESRKHGSDETCVTQTVAQDGVAQTDAQKEAVGLCKRQAGFMCSSFLLHGVDTDQRDYASAAAAGSSSSALASTTFTDEQDIG